MRMGAFLLGGIVGAAAVVYWSNKNKQMFAGLGSSDTVSHFMNMGMTSDASGKSQSGTSQTQSYPSNSGSGSGTKAASGKSKNSSNGQLFKEEGFNKIGDIVNQDPQLKAAVNEILEGNGEKDQYRTH